MSNGKVRDITKLSGYPRSNDKTRLEQSDFHYRMLSMITNCRFHGCDTVKESNGKMPGTKVLKKNPTDNNLDNILMQKH